MLPDGVFARILVVTDFSVLQMSIINKFQIPIKPLRNLGCNLPYDHMMDVIQHFFFTKLTLFFDNRK
jgi:hypothetical protein